MHGVFQARTGGVWRDVASSYDCRRDYHLYDWLGMGIEPIAKPRGLPADFPTKRYLGEWGFSWLLGAEIVGSKPPVRPMKISIPIDTYTDWDKVSNPKTWHELRSDWHEEDCAEHYATPDNISGETWWVIVDWAYDFTLDFAYFVNEVSRLMRLHGDVRFVFGFNS